MLDNRVRSLLPVIPVPVLVIGLAGGLQAMFLYLLATHAAREAEFATLGPPFLFSTLWFGGEHGVALREVFMTGNVVAAVLLWGNYRVGRRADLARPGVLEISYVGAALLLAALQWACRTLTLAVPNWTVTQIFP